MRLRGAASLGAHFCVDESVALPPSPIISGVAPLDAYFIGRGIRRIGLLGTRVVMRTRLYGKLVLTEALALEGEIDLIGQTYQDVAVAGACSSAQRALFLDAGRRLVAAGAEAIVLAGTDLNLAFDGQSLAYPVIDALDVHVALLADLAFEPDVARRCDCVAPDGASATSDVCCDEALTCGWSPSCGEVWSNSPTAHLHPPVTIPPREHAG